MSSSSFARIEVQSDSRRVQKVQDYINRHYQEEIRLATLANMVGMTEVSFSRFFKLRTGKSPRNVRKREEALAGLRGGFLMR